MTKLKDLRIFKGLTQKETAEITGIPLRTYKNYENDERKVGTIKYNYLVDELEKVEPLKKDVRTFDEIRHACEKIFPDYPIEYAILFGSYAKSEADSSSDVDLLISGSVREAKHPEIAQRLKEILHKDISLMDIRQAYGDTKMLNDVLQFGKKVYLRNRY